MLGAPEDTNLYTCLPHRPRDGASRGRTRRTDGRGMEVVPSKRSSTKNSMLAGLATTVKGKATSLREDARGKVDQLLVSACRYSFEYPS